MSTTFFTAADRRYEYFAVPYALCVLLTNPDAYVEICLEDPAHFAARNAAAIEALEKHFPGRFHFRGGTFGSYLANSVRFLETPEIRSEHTYIGDIDILVLEHVTPIHLAQMERTGLPYSNIRRPRSHKLTGLHFTRTDAHYPIQTAALDLNKLKMSDEELLFHLVQAKGHSTQGGTERPLHGLHLSPNRRPVSTLGEPDWRLQDRPNAEAFYRLLGSEAWSEVEPHFDPRFVTMQLLLQTAFDCLFPDLVPQSAVGKKFAHPLKRLQKSQEALVRFNEEIARLKDEVASRDARVARLKEKTAALREKQAAEIARLREGFRKVRSAREATIARQRLQLAAYANSRSWRLTAPFRSLSARLNRLRVLLWRVGLP